MKNIIKFTLVLAGIACLSNSSCQKDTIEGLPTSGYNVMFEAGLNDRIILPKDRKEVLFTVTSISDSRCPKNVECIWAGNASVSVSLENAQGQTTAELCLGKCKAGSNEADTANVVLDGTSYSIILKSLNPYPVEGSSTPKKAGVIIKKN